MAACAVPEINRALALSLARKNYIANLRPEISEDFGFSLQDHVDTLRAHGVEPTAVIVDVHSQFAHQPCSVHTFVTSVTARNPMVHDVPKLTQAVIDACAN
jgi:hypothetical protein